jgi:Secretion system C-terminal sorting domain
VSLLHETDQPFLSPFVKHGNDIWYASGISNGFEPVVYHHNLTKTIVDTLYISPQGSPINGLIPLTYQDGKLYFMSHIEASNGREMYSLPVTGVVGAEETLAQNDLQIKQNKRQVWFTSEFTNDQIAVSIYDQSGRLVQSAQVLPQQSVMLDALPQGIYFVHARNQANDVSGKIWID